uniref:Uncharacterized protein n=1 Tax=Arundo donax TaxID=35708 RepID=A0A0A9SZW0_ARUDO
MSVTNKTFAVGLSICKHHCRAASFLDNHPLRHARAAATVADDNLAFHQRWVDGVLHAQRS